MDTNTNTEKTIIAPEAIEMINKIDRDSSLELKNKYKHRAAAWLYWPVQIPGQEKSDLHITAKWFGESPVTVEEISSELFGMDHRLKADTFKWEPVVFDTKNDGVVPVLELLDFPSMLTELNSKLSKFRQDDYASYRPHISVSDEYWNEVGEKKITPLSAGLTVGELQLKMPSGRQWVFKDGLNKAEEIEMHLDEPEEVEEPEEQEEVSAQDVIDKVESLKTGR